MAQCALTGISGPFIKTISTNSAMTGLTIRQMDTNREADYQAHHWTPETYGLMGNYGYDAK